MNEYQCPECKVALEQTDDNIYLCPACAYEYTVDAEGLRKLHGVEQEQGGGLMFGEPKDKDGECNARLYISDDFGDNHATMRCQLSPGHNGPHEEKFERGGQPVVITWYVDERGSF